MFPWWIFLVLILIVYVILVEPRSQDLKNGKCNNSTPSVTQTDSWNDAIDKTIETTRKNHTLVGWRRALFVALLTSFPILFFLLRKFPSGTSYICTLFTVFLATYILINWLDHYWWRPRDTAIEQYLLSLRI